MKQIVAVGSGKGGVGKSTVAVNLSVALANAGADVALIDVDFYGPSVPTLMGGGELKVNPQEKFIPAVRYGVKYISIGFFLKNPDDPIVWRGPMFGKAIGQLFNDVDWGQPDICIIDLPPGTGDAQLSLAQMIKIDGAVMVTTPQEVAMADVRKAINMFEKVNVPVVGIVENMAGFTTPSGEMFEIFGSGGGQQLSERFGIPLLASIPIDLAIREGGDSGVPVALSERGQVFAELATTLKGILGAQSHPILKVVN